MVLITKDVLHQLLFYQIHLVKVSIEHHQNYFTRIQSPYSNTTSIYHKHTGDYSEPVQLVVEHLHITDR